MNYTTATLKEILAAGDKEDLDVLVDYITDSGQGRVSLDKSTCTSLVGAKARPNYTVVERHTIEDELRKFGGNSVANVMRSVRDFLGGLGSNAPATVTYDEIVRDVAEHLKVKFDKYAGTPQVEEGILKALLVASFEKMAEGDRANLLGELGVVDALDVAKRGAAAATAGAAAAFGATQAAALLSAFAFSRTGGYFMARSVAAASAQALLGRSMFMGTTALLARPIAALAGPIGWAVTGAWALADMASPAYRVTVPCVVQVAYMRRKAEMNA
ncbi:ubiquinol-cytochrome C chaperone family protein [Variovorax sp. Sphag1AA]|uniref:ubiquinol-cytochrome C chaperone family protein n=1 Tax=Variovorax sp. Sphag1AA TaxID=2587027 RepID=UPI0016177247|nr:ubiquinol-cytochrome C chaperone family protein [Variovorax sp. Sphag1AA]MBB3182281.1 uncharacterized protein YaaW (UPF0174 family) [Variovorax sp. Sphag1AA]